MCECVYLFLISVSYLRHLEEDLLFRGQGHEMKWNFFQQQKPEKNETLSNKVTYFNSISKPISLAVI